MASGGPSGNLGGSVTFPHDLDAQRVWHAAHYQAPEPHPAPVVAARLASPHETAAAPRTVAGLRSLAWANGWRANPTYAKGWRVGAHGKRGRLVESLALRMRYDVSSLPSIGAVAVWESKATGGYSLALARFWPCAGTEFPMAIGADELRHLVTHVSLILDMPEAWRWRKCMDLVDAFREVKADERAKRAEVKGGLGFAPVGVILDELAGQTALALDAA